MGNTVYRGIAVKLTNWENHRTNTQWDRYLVTKTFLFKFVNSYASFFYVAFLKLHLEGRCGTRTKPKTCMVELSSQIPLIFVSQMVVGNTAETLSPWIKFKMRTYMETKNMKKDGAPPVDLMKLYEVPELECKKEEYKPTLYSFDDYSEMVLQYGYVILFVSAFPLAPVFALLNNTLELHIDAFKLICVFRRPWPFAAANIGQWAIFMDLLSSVSVVTNLLIIIFTSDTLNGDCKEPTGGVSQCTGGLAPLTKWIAFIVLEHLLLASKSIVSYVIPDTPGWVADMTKRQAHVVSKIKGMEADDDEGLVEQAEEVSLQIHENSFKFGQPKSKLRSKKVNRKQVVDQPGPGNGRKLMV